MNKEQLEAIKERVAKATPGEWSIEYGAVITKHPDFRGVSDGVFGLHSAVCHTNDGEYIENSNAINDSHFIAHARQDVPALIAEVERLQRFKNYFDELHGEGLEMANWHQNGDLELFDNFYKEAVNFMEKESCD